MNYAEQRRVFMAGELEKFRNFHAAKGSTFKDWQAAWRTWCDKAVEFGRAGSATAKQGMSFAQQDELNRRRRWEEMTNEKWPGDQPAAIDVMAKEVGGQHVIAA